MIVYSAEYGAAPQPSELETLIAFTNPQYSYGQHIGVMDPVVYAYEALGAAMSGSQYFQQGLAVTPNDADFVSSAYMGVFHQSGTPAQIDAFLNQLQFLEAFYTEAHLPNANLVARGAVFGQMLGVEAEMTQVPIVGTSAHV
jgi:hypothetical protein